MAKPKKRLSENVATLIRMGVKNTGSYDPDEVMPFIEEELTVAENEQARMFLSWVYDNKKTFGRNIKEVYAEFVAAVTPS